MNAEMQEYARALSAAYRTGHIDRRDFIKGSALLGLSLPLLDRPRVQAATPVRGGTLHFAVEPPATIEPHELNDDPGIGIVHQACEMLVDIDVAGVLVLAWPHSGRPARGARSGPLRCAVVSRFIPDRP